MGARDAARVDGEAGVDATAVVEAGEDAGGDASEAAADAACTMTSAVVDYCASIPPLPAAPVIDGLLDCGPALVPFTQVGWRGAAPLPPFPAGNSASVAAAWRPDGIYVFIAAATPAAFPADPTSPVYFGAGAEIFIDDDGMYASPPSYDNPGTVQVIATAPAAPWVDGGADAAPDAPGDAALEAADDGAIDGAADALADASAGTPNDGHRAVLYRNTMILGPWSSSQFGTFLTPDGFVFEGFFTAADLGLTAWSLAAGQHVGFDVAVDVSFPTPTMTGGEGHRAGQYFFHVGYPALDAAAEAGEASGPDADAATDAGDAGDAAPTLPPVGPPYMDSRSLCNPTLTSM
jgi:hypothetical protein